MTDTKISTDKEIIKVIESITYEIYVADSFLKQELGKRQRSYDKWRKAKIEKEHLLKLILSFIYNLCPEKEND